MIKRHLAASNSPTGSCFLLRLQQILKTWKLQMLVDEEHSEVHRAWSYEEASDERNRAEAAPVMVETARKGCPLLLKMCPVSSGCFHSPAAETVLHSPLHIMWHEAEPLSDTCRVVHWVDSRATGWKGIGGFKSTAPADVTDGLVLQTEQARTLLGVHRWTHPSLAQTGAHSGLERRQAGTHGHTHPRLGETWWREGTQTV